MAVASCGMLWSWDSPLWCSGKMNKDSSGGQSNTDNMCFECPWWKGNKDKEIL